MHSATVCTGVLSGALVLMAASANPAPTAGPRHPAQWSPVAAASYMDGREIWWQGWRTSQRDHQTVCISCHSAVPYSLARPALRRDLPDNGPSAQEQFLLAGVTKRVGLWNEVLPFYTDEKQGAPKSAEARGTESVLNALVLANQDAMTGRLADTTRMAFDAMWALQLKSGDAAGTWNWLNFHLSPWESTESQYFGATMAALAVGMAPGQYAAAPEVQENIARLKAYLQRQYDRQPLLNRIDLLWANARWPGLMTAPQRAAVIDSLFARQRDDGGWALPTLGTWQRRDSTALDTRSDGYATGLVVLALEEAGVSAKSPQLARGVTWLEEHQDPVEGSWSASSLNKQRDPATGRGRFMTDAATAYAVLALERARPAGTP